MALTTLDSIIAGRQAVQLFNKVTTAPKAAGTPHSLWYAPGMPPAGAAPGASLNGANYASSSYVGALPFVAPTSQAILERLVSSSTQPGTLWLIDRLWANGNIAITTTTIQAITSPTWPARDSGGATTGHAVYIALECNNATTNGSATSPTLSATDTNAVANTTCALSQQWPATASAGTFIPFNLGTTHTGDGIASVQGVTLNTSLVSGTVNLVAFRVIAMVSLGTANVANSIDIPTSGMPNLYANSCLAFVWMPTGTTAPILTGQFIEAMN